MVEVGVVAGVTSGTERRRRLGSRRGRAGHHREDALGRVSLVVVRVADQAVDAGVHELLGLTLGVGEAGVREHVGEEAFHHRQVATDVALAALAELNVGEVVREPGRGRQAAGAVEHSVSAATGEHHAGRAAGDLVVHGVLHLGHGIGVTAGAEGAGQVAEDVVVADDVPEDVVLLGGGVVLEGVNPDQLGRGRLSAVPVVVIRTPAAASTATGDEERADDGEDQKQDAPRRALDGHRKISFIGTPGTSSREPRRPQVCGVIHRQFSPSSRSIEIAGGRGLSPPERGEAPRSNARPVSPLWRVALRRDRGTGGAGPVKNLVARQLSR